MEQERLRYEIRVLMDGEKALVIRYYDFMALTYIMVVVNQVSKS